MSPIKPGDISALIKLFNFLIKCQSLSRSSRNNPLGTPEIICIILSKLPFQLQDRWNRNTLKMRRMHSREPQLFDLANFAGDEMTLVSDPLYSRDAVSHYMEKNQKFIKSKRFPVNTVKAEKLGKARNWKLVIDTHHCAMKTTTLKIVFSFYSRHWKNEVSYFIRENYVMDVLKKSLWSIMQNLVQTEEYARYAIANIQQHFMDMSERKSKMIIKRMVVQIHQIELMWNVPQSTLVEMW